MYTVHVDTLTLFLGGGGETWSEGACILPQKAIFTMHRAIVFVFYIVITNEIPLLCITVDEDASTERAKSAGVEE
jgi:hypothetical protein